MLTQLLQSCYSLICGSRYSSLKGLYQPFAWTGILWIPDVSGKEIEQGRKLELWTEVKTCTPESPAPSKLPFGKCIFETFLLYVSWKGRKKKQTTNWNLLNMNHSAKWCSVIFLTFKTAPVAPYQLIPLSRYSRANAHQNVVDFAAAIGNYIGSFETRQEPSTSHDTESWKTNASSTCEKTLSSNRVNYMTYNEENRKTGLYLIYSNIFYFPLF